MSHEPGGTPRLGPNSGRLIVISGPSGAGKSTVVRQLLQTSSLPLELSVSATTRPPRPGETSGVHYWFLSGPEFQTRRERGEFLEYFEVFGRGVWYGTLVEPVTSGLKRGKWLILEIDVHGAQQVLRKFPDAITLFVHPGSLEELERRLRGRQTESESDIARRLDVAREELQSLSLYRHVVVNTDVHACVREISGILDLYRDH